MSSVYVVEFRDMGDFEVLPYYFHEYDDALEYCMSFIRLELKCYLENQVNSNINSLNIHREYIFKCGLDNLNNKINACENLKQLKKIWCYFFEKSDIKIVECKSFKNFGVKL